MQRPGGVGLLMMVIGGLLAGYLGCGAQDRGVPGESLPGVLIGLSMVAFGWSLLSRDRRRPRRD